VCSREFADFIFGVIAAVLGSMNIGSKVDDPCPVGAEFNRPVFLRNFHCAIIIALGEDKGSGLLASQPDVKK